MGRLHCAQGPVPEAVGGDMQQLNQLGAQVGPADWRGPAGRPEGARDGAGRLASGSGWGRRTEPLRGALWRLGVGGR